MVSCAFTISTSTYGPTLQHLQQENYRNSLQMEDVQAGCAHSASKDIQYQCPVYFFAAGVSYTKLALDSLDSEFLKSLRLSALAF